MTEKLYTEREKVLAERAAVVRTLERTARVYSLSYASEIARQLFPLPNITRPRQMALDGSIYRVVDGQFQVREDNDTWDNLSWVRASCIKEFAELLDNPTETVEDTGDAL